MIEQNRISEVYDSCHKELLIYIFSFVKSMETAEDILHDSFVHLMKYSVNHDTTEFNIKAYLYKIARNLCIDLSRRNKKIIFSELNEDIVHGRIDHDQMELDEMHKIIDSILNKFDKISCSIFYLKKEMNMTYNEISTNLGISERTAKRKMSSVLEKLAIELEKSGYFGLFLIFLSSLLN